MTCYAFLPAYQKDEAPYPRFDTSLTSQVKAGLFDGSQIDAQKIKNFVELKLSRGTAVQLAALTVLLSTILVF